MKEETISILIMLAAVVGMWFLFPLTISRSKRYRTSQLAMLGKRLGATIGAGILSSMISNAIIFNKEDAQKNNSQNSNISPGKSNEIQDVYPAQKNPSHSKANAEFQHAQQGDDKAPKVRVYSDDEISEMEDLKQYHGDDPIVRKRLGLPSRETGTVE